MAQPAVIQHINGDWFVMVPEKDFSLKPGDSIDISYRGIEAVIKESDAPSGLYFAFYDTIVAFDHLENLRWDELSYTL